MSAAESAAVSFRPLRVGDLDRMHHWLNHEFVARWWTDRPSAEQVAAKYGAYIRGERPTQSFIIEVANEPVGYIQAYRIRDWPDYARDVAIDEDAAGIDLFIGEPDHARRGLGPIIIRRFLAEIVFATMDVASCIIGPFEGNRDAIRAYEKAGFRHLKTVSVAGEPEPEYLMRIGRDEFRAHADA
jgi:RimJ/RimL family protein N-acetyltransferase